MKFVGRNARKTPVYECECQCGTTRNLVITSITSSGGSKSCGCTGIGRPPTHGATMGRKSSAEYSVWDSMLDRCYSETVASYPRYGGRGIYVCDGWRRDFAVFRADMGPRPSRKYSIDRIDNDGSYTCGHCDDCKAKGVPFNCRWATPQEQGRNKSTNRMLTAFGETLCLAEWADRNGITSDALSHRIAAGFDIERAVSQPMKPDRRRHGSTPAYPAASNARKT